MTREEAKIFLLQLHTDKQLNKSEHEALRIAIKVLEQEPCEDAISRQAVLGILKDKWNMFSDANDAMQESIETIEAFPPATPQPKTGHWNNWFTGIKGNDTFNCMECGSTFIVEQGTHNMNYCPNCGCRMVEPQESEDKE